MEYRGFNDTYYIRLDRGDEIIGSLTKLCEAEKIYAARVSGIGGCGTAAVGVFDPDKKIYNEHSVEATLELISLDGNVTRFENKPYLHLHASFAYHEGGEARVLAGHLLKAVISLTGEIVVTPAEGLIGRRYDEELGIRTWEFQ